MTRTLTLLGYLVVVLAAVGLEAHARRRGGTTLADVLRQVVRHRPTRLLLVAGWMWLGWHLFVRVDWPG